MSEPNSIYTCTMFCMAMISRYVVLWCGQSIDPAMSFGFQEDRQKLPFIWRWMNCKCPADCNLRRKGASEIGSVGLSIKQRKIVKKHEELYGPRFYIRPTCAIGHVSSRSQSNRQTLQGWSWITRWSNQLGLSRQSRVEESRSVAKRTLFGLGNLISLINMNGGTCSDVQVYETRGACRRSRCRTDDQPL